MSVKIGGNCLMSTLFPKYRCPEAAHLVVGRFPPALVTPSHNPPNNKVSSRQICVLKHLRPKLLNTCNVCNF